MIVNSQRDGDGHTLISETKHAGSLSVNEHIFESGRRSKKPLK